MKTLYISDLDGTLLDGKSEINSETARILNLTAKAGFHFTVASARTVATAQKILSGVRFLAPAALMNGAVFYDLANEKYDTIHYFGETTTKSLINAIHSQKAEGLLYCIEKGTLTTYYESSETPALREFMEERRHKYGKVFVRVRDFSEVNPAAAMYISLIGSHTSLAPVFDATGGYSGVKSAFYDDSAHPGRWYVEFFSDLADKYHAVSAFREKFGYKRVIGFGDNLNDLPLAKACDEFYAVANAKPEVIKAANAVIGSNSDNGVAKWLESNLF